MEEFYKIFNISKCSNYRQYNHGRIDFGLEELQKSLDKGIECKYINKTPTSFNPCVYWTEYYYPEVTDKRLLDLLFTASAHGFYFDSIYNREDLKNILFRFLIESYTEELREKVEKIFC